MGSERLTGAYRESWAVMFRDSHLRRGERAASRFVLLSQEDAALLVLAAQAAGLSPSVMAARLLSKVLHDSAPRYL